MSNEQQHSNMNVEEAWMKLHNLILGDEGLIHQIEQDQTITPTSLQEIEESFAIIKDTWKPQRTLPREQALLLWRISIQLKQTLAKEQTRDQELRVWLRRLEAWMENVLDTSQISPEEEAMAVLLQHLLGGPSFGLQLREGYINKAFFQDLLRCLQELKNAWDGKPDIPLRACKAMFASKQLQWSSRIFSQTEQQKLGDMQQLLYQQIDDCLQGSTPGMKE